MSRAARRNFGDGSVGVSTAKHAISWQQTIHQVSAQLRQAIGPTKVYELHWF